MMQNVITLILENKQISLSDLFKGIIYTSLHCMVVVRSRHVDIKPIVQFCCYVIPAKINRYMVDLNMWSSRGHSDVNIMSTSTLFQHVDA
jgi:hypothetical protein